MREVVIVEAVRSPVGRRNGGLSTMHSVELLAAVQQELIRRSGIDPTEVGQVVGGCVSQVGMQGFNVARTAWLTAGLPIAAAATTVDAQCGSSQQATNLATALVASGVVDVAVGCGVEVMSRVPMGASMGQGVGKAVPKSYFSRYQWTSQFQGAELIAQKWGIGRDELDAFGKRSQDLAAKAWAEGRFEREVVPVEAPQRDKEGNLTGEVLTVDRDQGLRETTLESLANLKPVMEGALHTAGTSSQISDGAAAVLWMDEDVARARGLRPKARITYHTMVGTDPYYGLDGPVHA
ncbi:MAG TPA: acetyl-CoA C-acyltransferase, partial [Acidimicrobiales bacterium]|nr:acetyl-CoA C-acyltransferase [Acidimicrobiales bacterium]